MGPGLPGRTLWKVLLRGLLRPHTCARIGNRCILTLLLTLCLTLFFTAGGGIPWMRDDLSRADRPENACRHPCHVHGERGVHNAGFLPAQGPGSEEVADRRHVNGVFLLWKIVRRRAG